LRNIALFKSEKEIFFYSEKLSILLKNLVIMNEKTGQTEFIGMRISGFFHGSGGAV
jgi:hypothetical protein